MCLSYKLKWLWRTKFFLFIFVDRTKDNNQEKWAWNENWENCKTSSLPSNRCVVVINKKWFSLWNIHVLLAVLAWLCRPRKLVKGQESESHEIIGGNLAKEISFCFVIYFFSQIHVTLIQFAHSSRWHCHRCCCVKLIFCSTVSEWCGKGTSKTTTIFKVKSLL